MLRNTNKKDKNIEKLETLVAVERERERERENTLYLICNSLVKACNVSYYLENKRKIKKKDRTVFVSNMGLSLCVLKNRKNKYKEDRAGPI